MSTLAQIQSSFNEIQSMYDAGEIGKEEYVNLLQGLEVEKTTTLNAEELQFKEQLHSYINAAITAASLV